MTVPSVLTTMTVARAPYFGSLTSTRSFDVGVADPPGEKEM